MQQKLSPSRQPTPSSYELREYQKRVIGEIYGHYRWGKKSVMLVSPTGSGKTLTAVHIIRDAISRGLRVLFIVQREPLIDQTVNTLVAYGIPGSEVGYIKAGYPHAETEAVIVASVQTLARRDYPPHIGLVVFDETHTTSFWETSKDLINYYAQSPVISISQVKFLHLTATPFRTKTKEYFGNHVDAIVRAPSIGELIKMGYLVNARHFGYGGLLDFSKLEVARDGDYKSSQLSIVCADEEYNREVVNQFLTHCPDRKAIAFCAGVEQSQLLTELFNEAGITAEHIQAETPHHQRRAIYQRFREGTTQIMSSVGTLCLDSQTEILTAQGWVGIDDISYTHKVANWDNGRIFFKEPENIVIRPRKLGERMIRFHSARLEARVTEEHKMLIQNRGSRVKKVLAKSLVGKRVRIPISGIADPFPFSIEQEPPLPSDTSKRISALAYALRKNNGFEWNESFIEAEKRTARRESLRYKQPVDLTEDECKLIGFWITDGSKSRQNKGGYEWTLASTAKDTGVVSQVDDLLSSTRVKARKYVTHPKNCIHPFVRWSLKRGTLDDGGIYPIEPYLNKTEVSWLWSLSDKQFDAFIFGMWLGDGDHGQYGRQKPGYSHRIANCDKDLLGMVQAIAVCRGYYAMVSQRRGGKLYILFFKKASHSTVGSVNGQLPFIEENWIEERVWCVTTESKNIITRRNGKVVITGNCEGFDEPSCDAVILARPTRSQTLLIQMAGRGLRCSQGKEDCFLLDFGENFKRLGRIDKKHKITLCPQPAPKPETNLKECPNCHAHIWSFLMVCPECGYEFPPSNRLGEEEDSFLAEFGELLDEETQARVKYIRAQRKSRFTKGLPPDPLWNLWQQRYRASLLCNDWLYQAVFRGDTSEAAQQAFLAYLHQVFPNPRPDWVRFHMAVEFGDPRRLMKSKSKGVYSPPPLILSRRNWWEVLRIDPLSDFGQIKEAYGNLAAQAGDDEEMVKLLNWALETAKQTLRVYDWNDLMRWIDAEINRLGWSQQRASAYLIETYGRPSRLLLGDEQILDFWHQLKRME